MSISKEQEETRTKFLGASDIPCILGFNEWMKPWHVFWSKMPKEEWPNEYRTFKDRKPSKAIAFGNTLESHVVLYAVAYLTKVGLISEAETDFGFKTNTTHFHKQGILCANLDAELSRYLYRNKIIGNPCGIEAKTTGFTGKPLENWGRALSLDIPVRVAVQTQAQLICTSFESVWIAILSGHDASGIKMYQIEKDAQLQSMILEKSELFWNKYVLKKVAPPKELTNI